MHRFPGRGPGQSFSGATIHSFEPRPRPARGRRGKMPRVLPVSGLRCDTFFFKEPSSWGLGRGQLACGGRGGGARGSRARGRPLTGRALPGFDSLTVWARAGPSLQELQKCLTHIFPRLAVLSSVCREGLSARLTPQPPSPLPSARRPPLPPETPSLSERPGHGGRSGQGLTASS